MEQAPALPGVPASGALNFQASRNGMRIGDHLIRFHRVGDTMTVASTVSYSVSAGFLTAFQSTLRAQESWEGGMLASFQCTAVTNGRQEYARGARENGVLMVQGTAAPRYAAPDGTVLCAMWNRTQLTVPSINPQDGTLLRFVTTPLGRSEQADSAGVRHGCDGFHMEGPNPVDVWYDDSDLWLALQAKAPDGSVILYKRQG